MKLIGEKSIIRFPGLKLAVVFFVYYLIAATLACVGYADDILLPVSLETAEISVTEAGDVELGEVVITALAGGVINPESNLLIKIPDNFPAVWDTGIRMASLDFDSPRGFINEVVDYPNEKTLQIQVTQTWPKDLAITITNLIVKVPEFPSYEDMFSGEVTNFARLNLSGFNYSDSNEQSCLSTGTILLKVPPLYAGDDGWSSTETAPGGVVYGYEFCNWVSSYKPNIYLAGRGFKCVVYAVDETRFWVNSTETIDIKSVISTAPTTDGKAKFYTNDTYQTELTSGSITLVNGWAEIYIKDIVSENIIIKAEDSFSKYGLSQEIKVEPYVYNITSVSPQTVGLGWYETVTVKDLNGNTITDSIPEKVNITSTGNARFYENNTYSDNAPTEKEYALTNGTCQIFIRDDVAENIEIRANDIYDSFSKLNGGGESDLIVVTLSLWQIRMNFSYAEAEGDNKDSITVQAWLEKGGNLVNDSYLGDAILKIYDGESLKTTLSPITDKDPAADGTYWFSWEDTGLTTGRSYFAQFTIEYAGSIHNNNDDFYLPINRALGDLIQASTATMQDLKTTASGISEEVIEQMSEELIALKANTKAALAAAQTAIPTAITEMKDELAPHIYASILNAETQIAVGNTLTIRYRAPTGTSPTLDVYDSEQTQLVTDAAMEVVGTTGIYEYDLEFSSSWGEGFFTVVCSESTYNTLDGVTINVISTDLASISNDISGIMGATSGLSDLSNVSDILDVEFNNISNKLEEVNSRISATVGEAVKGALKGISGAQVDAIYNTMNEVSEVMYDISEVTSGDLEALYDVSQSGTGDLTDMRNRFITLENLLQINRRMIDTVTYEPITQIWYEFR